ncbi:hypothetical protein A0H81_02946 [Grifola frondosa]|uniref:4-hydroxybenzoate polyprenyltransferase, mitochondrial n=1 Tax=Grifola frondosa TaxID=5627 RepID=A0A1C7MIS4_GRIFR|nr:hypothetical protein A0H81_02946 [Grifola frondosa]
MSMSESTLLQPATTYSKLESAVSAKDVTPPLWLSYVKLTRIHKFPHGIILVVWPCMWGLAMSAYSAKLSLTSWVIQSVAYLVGSVLRHNASCIWGTCVISNTTGKSSAAKVAHSLVDWSP